MAYGEMCSMTGRYRRVVILLITLSVQCSQDFEINIPQKHTFLDSLPSLNINLQYVGGYGVPSTLYAMSIDSSEILCLSKKTIAYQGDSDSLLFRIINGTDIVRGAYKFVHTHKIWKLIKAFDNKYLVWGTEEGYSYNYADYLALFDNKYVLIDKSVKYYGNRDSSNLFIEDVTFRSKLYCLKVSMDSTLYICELDSSLDQLSAFRTSVKLKMNDIVTFVKDNSIHIFSNTYTDQNNLNIPCITKYEIDLNGNLINSFKICDSCSFAEVTEIGDSYIVSGSRIVDTIMYPLLISWNYYNNSPDWIFSTMEISTAFYSCTSDNQNGYFAACDSAIVVFDKNGYPVKKIENRGCRQLFYIGTKIFIVNRY
jgi:hypothetical protein